MNQSEGPTFRRKLRKKNQSLTKIARQTEWILYKHLLIIVIRPGDLANITKKLCILDGKRSYSPNYNVIVKQTFFWNCPVIVHPQNTLKY